MIRKLDEGLIQIRGWLVSCYLLVEGERAWLIDGGFVGDLGRIEKALGGEGLGWENLEGVLLTHGHLDHTHNVAEIVQRSGARVYGHALESEHFAGRGRYAGASRLCGWLEDLGRRAFGYEAVVVDVEIADGEVLTAWGGLRVIHTPGHTEGHCSFYSESRGLIFAGDLCANGIAGLPLVMWPWFFFNTCPE